MVVKSLIVALTLSVATPAIASAQDLTEDRVRALVLEVIRDNPEIVREALMADEERRVSEAREAGLEQVRQILADPSYPRVGDPDAESSGVVLMDYNCPHCRRTHAEIESWMEANPGHAITIVEFPVLGDGSIFAAHAALAAHSLGIYEQVSNALMTSEDRITPETLETILIDAGVDIQTLFAELSRDPKDEILAANRQLGVNLGISGTPGAVFGDQIVHGAFTAQDLDQLIQ